MIVTNGTRKSILSNITLFLKIFWKNYKNEMKKTQAKADQKIDDDREELLQAIYLGVRRPQGEEDLKELQKLQSPEDPEEFNESKQHEK